MIGDATSGKIYEKLESNNNIKWSIIPGQMGSRELL